MKSDLAGCVFKFLCCCNAVLEKIEGYATFVCVYVLVLLFCAFVLDVFG